MRSTTVLSVSLVLLLSSWSIEAAEEPSHDSATAVPKAIDFNDYVSQYGKSYDQLEAIERAKLFLGRTISIFKHNVEYATNRIGHFLRQTEYIDQSPRELTQKFSKENLDFRPVEEATRWPEYPANDYYNAQQDGGYSMLSADDLDKSTAVETPRHSSVNFLEASPIESPNDFRDTDANREQLRMAARLSSRVSASGGQLLPEDKAARKSNRIKYEPIIESENPNFDPSLLPSQGVLGSMHKFESNYATFMMDDFSANLQPYPTVADTKPAHDQPDQATAASGFGLSSFMSSIRAISDYFSAADEQMDIDEEEDAKQSDNVAAVSGQPVVPANSLIDPQLISPISYDVDWRKTGCISRIKWQKDCNACYALATLDLMEFFYCRQKKIATEFSVQYIIDCGARNGLNGCQGGKLSNVGQFIRNYGIQLNAFYPFRASQQECPFDQQDYTRRLTYTIKPQITGWKMFTQISDWYKWLPRSPLIVGISMPSDFLAYGGGVHEGTDCVPDMVHAMLLVGSGVQDGKQFWLLKNTFSYAWGENGYFRLSKQAPLKCFNSAVVARANFNAAQT